MNEKVDFPQQKKAEKQKTESWAKKCVKSACNNGLYSDEFFHDYKEIRTNMDLYNGVLDVDDMLSMCDPFGVQGDDFPFKPQHYPVANAKINLLLGEEMKRRFDWKCTVLNSDAVSEKEKDKKKLINQKFMEIAASGKKPEEIKQHVKEFDSYMNFEYQDIRERRATHLLRHMVAKEDMRYRWNMGFLDGLNAGREIYSLDIVAGDPRCRKVNPSQIKIIRRGQSPDVADADIIIEWGYHSRGVVLDDYHEWLKDPEVKSLETMGVTNSDTDNDTGQLQREPDLMAGTFSMTEDKDGNLVSTEDTAASKMLSFVDDNGNILVTRVVWRSFRKIGKLIYYDARTGEENTKFVDEFYKPRENKGEKIEKYIWVTDWWEGTRIGENIFCKMRPFPVKSHSATNPTGTLCPYIGGDYTVEGEPTTSLMSRMKPYSYYYNFIMHKQWETIGKNKGTVGYLDLAMIPEGWDENDALYWADKMGWLPIDSFKEAKKGQATGTLAGSMNNNRTPMNFDMGNLIQQNHLTLQFIKEEISSISGVSRQREGAISNSELVGNTERAVTQSSHITELYFHFHDRIKVACLQGMLETAKHAYRGRKIHVQYLLDDQTQMMAEIDGNELSEIHYGISIGYIPEFEQLKQTITNVAMMGIKSEKVNFQQALSVLLDPSISSMRRKVESAEMEKQQNDAAAAQQQQEAMKEIEGMKMQGAQQMMDFEAKIEEYLESVRTQGKMDLEKVKGVIQSTLKTTQSADVAAKIESEVSQLGSQHEHEKTQDQKDREHEQLLKDKDVKNRANSSKSP